MYVDRVWTHFCLRHGSFFGTLTGFGFISVSAMPSAPRTDGRHVSENLVFLCLCWYVDTVWSICFGVWLVFVGTLTQFGPSVLVIVWFFWYVDRVWTHFSLRHGVDFGTLTGFGVISASAMPSAPFTDGRHVFENFGIFGFFGTLTQFGASVLVIVWFFWYVDRVWLHFCSRHDGFFGTLTGFGFISVCFYTLYTLYELYSLYFLYSLYTVCIAQSTH